MRSSQGIDFPACGFPNLRSTTVQRVAAQNVRLKRARYNLHESLSRTSSGLVSSRLCRAGKSARSWNGHGKDENSWPFLARVRKENKINSHVAAFFFASHLPSTLLLCKPEDFLFSTSRMQLQSRCRVRQKFTRVEAIASVETPCEKLKSCFLIATFRSNF